MQDIEIVVENDHIERLTSASPLVALSELIWNAYDVDAKVVRVEFEAGKLTKLGHIRVIDDGTGIPFDQAANFFQSLGGSWKKHTIKTPSGRFIHGKKGQGRFKAYALGESVTWVSKSGGKSFSISGSKSDLKRFRLTDVAATDRSGCTVEIDDVLRDFKIRAEHGFADQIRDVFALQLYEDAQFQIIYDGENIDARDSIKSVTPYQIDATNTGNDTLTGNLEIVEWKKKIDRKLMLCLPGRFSFHSIAPGIHARGFDFTRSAQRQAGGAWRAASEDVSNRYHQCGQGRDGPA